MHSIVKSPPKRLFFAEGAAILFLSLRDGPAAALGKFTILHGFLYAFTLKADSVILM